MPFIEKVLVLGVFGLGALVAGVEICFLVDFLRCRVKPDSRKSKLFSKPAMVVHVLALVGLVCYCYGYFVEPYSVQVNRMTIATDKLKDTSFTVVQISDMHCDTKMRNEEKLVRIVNEIAPDVIVFTGDAINSEKAGGLFRKTMKSLDAKVAKLAVRGNWFERIESSEMFEGTGFRVLEKKSVNLEKDGETINVAGLNFWDLQSGKYLLRYNDPDKFNIFLYHTPDLVEDIASSNVDLYLAGHTHGGQVCLPFYGAILTFSKFGKKYEAGRYKVGDTELYVNRGLGMEGGKAPRVRFFARPEIAVFDIVPRKQ
jgi:predicted MPP superfamily phosphohydrolase